MLVHHLVAEDDVVAPLDDLVRIAVNTRIAEQAKRYAAIAEASIPVGIGAAALLLGT